MGAARKKLTQAKWSRVILLAAALAVALAALAIPTRSAFAQSNPFMPKMSLGGKDEKKPLTPEEQERQKRLDDAYKAATNKIPDQTASDPWASVRPAPVTPAPKKKPQ
ncbi:MAG TPA: hypothetical protein VEI98_12975 [Xanthobacteraceae bacterium]|nr:hypothetical protein [Xanthobacteraceae bacterium]